MFYSYQPGTRDSFMCGLYYYFAADISMMTRLTVGVRFLAGAEIVSFPQAPHRLWGPYQLPLSSAKRKRAWSCTSKWCSA
jgi:hypothetical protein